MLLIAAHPSHLALITGQRLVVRDLSLLSISFGHIGNDSHLRRPCILPQNAQIYHTKVHCSGTPNARHED